MSKKAGNIEIASEAFQPSLDGTYTELFNNLLDRLGQALPINRVEIIEEEIKTVMPTVTEKIQELFNYKG